ncbi:hypothetical protein JST97_10305 [bacterium]|nr:hypothetical protein [bacterium]
MELDAYLAGLRSEGELVDSGVFEMDPVVALQKLEKFQYAEPTTYFFPLLAAAQPLGAAALSVTSQKQKIIIHYAGAELNQETLERLFCYAFSKNLAGLRHLALGVLGATRGERIRVELASGALRATFLDHRLKLLPPGPPGDGFRVEVHRTGWAGRLLGLGPALEVPSEQSLQVFLAHCPLPVSWNGKVLSQRLAWPQIPWRRVLQHRQGLYEVRTAAEIRPSPGNFSAELGLDVEAALHWVVDGVTFAEDPQQLGFPQARVVLCGPWKLDASYRRLVRDEHRQQALEAVRAELESMVVERKYRMLLTSSHLDIQAHLVTRLTLREDEGGIDQLYRHLLLDMETAHQEGVELPDHPLMLAVCQHFRRHYSPEQGFEFWYRASMLLTRAPLAALYCQSWELAKELADQVYGTMPAQRRHFLVRCWAWWGCASPPEEWEEWTREVMEILPREGDDPVVEREQNDDLLDRALEPLHQAESPRALVEWCQAGRQLVPLKYIFVHAHFDKGIREGENRLAAMRYRGLKV